MMARMMIKIIRMTTTILPMKVISASMMPRTMVNIRTIKTLIVRTARMEMREGMASRDPHPPRIRSRISKIIMIARRVFIGSRGV